MKIQYTVIFEWCMLDKIPGMNSAWPVLIIQSKKEAFIVLVVAVIKFGRTKLHREADRSGTLPDRFKIACYFPPVWNVHMSIDLLSMSLSFINHRN